jgi:ribosomal-protein-serine acetyltransferase
MFNFKIDDDIELRLLEERHADELFALTDRNREHLARWLPWVDATREVADTLAFIRRVRRIYADNKMYPTGIWHREQIAGTLGLQGLDWDAGSGEIGYWLGAEFEGNGVMTRACRKLISFGLEDLDLNRIAIRCHPENTRSSAIPKRLGFTLEGTLRECTRLGACCT